MSRAVIIVCAILALAVIGGIAFVYYYVYLPKMTAQINNSAQPISVSSSTANSMKANDALYVKSFNAHIVNDFNHAAMEMVSLGTDFQNRNYASATKDMQEVRSWLQMAQKENPENNGPFTDDIKAVSIFMDFAITNGLAGADNALADMQNKDPLQWNNAFDSNVTSYFTIMTDNYNAAKQEVAAWQAENQQ